MDPEKYVVHNVVQSTLTQSIIKICEQEMPNNIFSGKCMHVGCGPGNTTMSLLLPNLHPHATLIGTDIDEDMIEFANKNYRVERHLTFEVMDIQTKRLPDKYVCEFNHIFSFNTLQWCTDIRQAFVNIYHMLRSNGSALFYFEIKSDVPSILETLATDNRFAPYSQELSDVYLYSKPVSFFALGITKFLASIGFSIDTYNVEGFTIYGYEHFESVLATTLSSMSPLIHKLPIHLREKFRNQFASNFKKKYVHSSKKNSLKNNINTTILIMHVFKLPQLRYKFLLTSNEIPPNALVSNISLNEAHQENVHSVIEMYAKVLRYMTGKCMNISCGLGDVTNLLVSALDPNATLIGIDTSKSVIECARQLNKNERLTFEVLNIETKVLPEKYVSQFEHIFSFCALQQCKDIRQAFVNIHRMLRPGGFAVLWIKTESDISEILQTLVNDERFENHITMDKTKLLRMYDINFSLKRDTINILKDIGFLIRHSSFKVEYSRSKYFYEYLDFFINNILTPMISNMPPEKKEEFKEAFRNEIIKRSVDPNLKIGINKLLLKNVCKGDTATMIFADKRTI